VSRYRHAGAKGERKYSFYTFLTLALGGSGWSVSLPGRALPRVPIVQEAGVGLRARKIMQLLITEVSLYTVTVAHILQS
jgi:hypothetical protein